MSVKIDPTFSLSNWVAGNNVCNWTGITCNDQKRVVSVVLKYKELSGQIPPHMGNISFLTTLDLSYNYLSGSSTHHFGRLEKLQYLNLDGNHLQGSIPPSMGTCTNLLHLTLENNFLSGSIPAELSSLHNLEIVDSETTMSLQSQPINQIK
ncbi:hypothetical protein SUGI_0081010 [Cryptomeria japonica]|nr:hypothetical protein SUGI_0081010 [Cryptomeria japonica]